MVTNRTKCTLTREEQSNKYLPSGLRKRNVPVVGKQIKSMKKTSKRQLYLPTNQRPDLKPSRVSRAEMTKRTILQITKVLNLRISTVVVCLTAFHQILPGIRLTDVESSFSSSQAGPTAIIAKAYAMGNNRPVVICWQKPPFVLETLIEMQIVQRN